MNPAGLGWLNNHQLGINYYNKYLLKELGYRILLMLMCLMVMQVLFQLIFQFGASSLLYNTFSLGYSRVFADRVSAGLTIKYFLLTSNQPEYSGIGYYWFRCWFTLKSSITCILHMIANLNHSKLGTYEYDRLPIVGSLDLCIK